jgi:hypothetical protein
LFSPLGFLFICLFLFVFLFSLPPPLPAYIPNSPGKPAHILRFPRVISSHLIFSEISVPRTCNFQGYSPAKERGTHTHNLSPAFKVFQLPWFRVSVAAFRDLSSSSFLVRIRGLPLTLRFARRGGNSEGRRIEGEEETENQKRKQKEEDSQPASQPTSKRKSRKPNYRFPECYLVT